MYNAINNANIFDKNKLPGISKIPNYKGMSYQTWVGQWKKVGNQFGIDMKSDKEIIKEITICIFSLAQYSVYEDKNGTIGRLNLFQSKNSTLGLVTSGMKTNSSFVWYAESGKVNFVRNISAGYLIKPVETVRENGLLRMKDIDGYII